MTLPSLPSSQLRTTLAIALAALAVPTLCARAQQVHSLTEPPAFRVEQWTTTDGLPQNSVTAIAQAVDGTLWLGTFGGLVRFDGTSFRVVARDDSTGRHVDRILALAAAPDGTLWIGTEQQGLLRYRDGRFDQFTAAGGLPDDMLPALLVDRTGTLWVGGQRGGIARYADGRFERFRTADGVPFDHVISFMEGADGTIWVNTGNRFVTIEDGVPTVRGWQDRPDDAVRFALHSRSGVRWYGLPDGLVGVAEGAARRYGPETEIKRPSVMEEGEDGGYWLGTDNDGLFFFEPRPSGRSTVRQYPLPNGQLQFRVRTVVRDAEGNVWVGTNAKGLLRVKRNVFTTFTTTNGLSNDVATAITEDAAGHIWAATNCWGINVLDRSAGTVRVVKPRLPGDSAGDPCVFALTEQRPGTMWIGTWGGGLTRIAHGVEHRLKTEAGLSDSVVTALFTDRDGTVWVGTNDGGIASLAGDRVEAAYTTENGLVHNSVRTIYQTRDGALWIGTLEGLSRFADGRFTTYGGADGLSAEHVRALYEDAQGNLWAGTYGGGLNRFHDGRFTPVTATDGLAENVVSAILEDDRGYLWMSGNRGISQVSRAELIALTDGQERRVHAVLYGEGDGLLNAETNGGFQPSAWKDRDGHLWFPTVEGLAVVDPARVRGEQRPPPVTVEDVVVDGVPGDPRDGMVVGPGRPNLEFRYAAVSLSAPEHVTFRYRLEAFDDDWVEAGSRRVAYYPRLPAGRYRFTVTAANRDGVWNPAAAAVTFRVAAPFWDTWSFRLAAAAALIGLLGALLWRRELGIRRFRAAHEAFAQELIGSQEHERKRIARELHDGLGQDLLVARNRALLALRDEDLGAKPREQLEEITEVTARSLETVRQLTHTLTPYQLDHLGLTAALRAVVETMVDSAGLQLDIAMENVDRLLPVEGEINLYRIVQEALNNIVHHAGASKVTVDVRRTGSMISVAIADDGRGFTVHRDGTGGLKGGFGLTGMSERARILGTHLRVASARGGGTRIEMSVPVPAEERR